MADPSGVPDSIGEYVEIASDSDWPDSIPLFLQIDDGKPLPLFFDKDSCSRLLVGGTAWTTQISKATCQIAIPLHLSNASPHQLTLIDATGSFCDSSVVPAAKAGVSWQRAADTPWALSEYSLPTGDMGTPGMCNPAQEPDCQASDPELPILQWQNGQWLAGTIPDGFHCEAWNGKRYQAFRTSLELPQDSWASVRCCQDWQDGFPPDDCRDTLYFAPDTPPIQISEVHPAPEEGPEWMEIANPSSTPLPLQWIRLQATSAVDSGALLKPGAYVILTSDTGAFLEQWGSQNVQEVQGWNTLRDRGDTIQVYLRRTLSNQLSWTNAKRGGSVTPLAIETPSPGFVRQALHRHPSWSSHQFRSGNRTLICPGECTLRVVEGSGRNLFLATPGECRRWHIPQVQAPVPVLLMEDCNGKVRNTNGLLLP